MNGDKLVKGLFNIDIGLDKNYVGYANPEDKWNGWACPYFEEDEAMQALEDAEYVVTHEMITLKDGQQVIALYDRDDCEIKHIEGEVFEIAGEEKILFPVGNCSWCWESVNVGEYRTAQEEAKKNQPLLEAIVEEDDREFIINIYTAITKSANWWCVFNSKDRKLCEAVAERLNESFDKLGLTKEDLESRTKAFEDLGLKRR